MSVLTLFKTQYSEITVLNSPIVFRNKNSHRTGKLKPTHQSDIYQHLSGTHRKSHATLSLVVLSRSGARMQRN